MAGLTLLGDLARGLQHFAEQRRREICRARQRGKEPGMDWRLPAQRLHIGAEIAMELFLAASEDNHHDAEGPPYRDVGLIRQALIEEGGKIFVGVEIRAAQPEEGALSGVLEAAGLDQPGQIIFEEIVLPVAVGGEIADRQVPWCQGSSEITSGVTCTGLKTCHRISVSRRWGRGSEAAKSVTAWAIAV